MTCRGSKWKSTDILYSQFGLFEKQNLLKEKILHMPYLSWLILDISYCRYLAHDSATQQNGQQNFTVAISPVLSHCRSLMHFLAISWVIWTKWMRDRVTVWQNGQQCDKTGEIAIVKFCECLLFSRSLARFVTLSWARLNDSAKFRYQPPYIPQGRSLGISSGGEGGKIFANYTKFRILQNSGGGGGLPPYRLWPCTPLVIT